LSPPALHDPYTFFESSHQYTSIQFFTPNCSQLF
jgi:hypothetical protein